MKRLSFLIFSCCWGFMAGASFDVTSLKVSGRSEPLGIDSPSPTFSWKVESQERDFYQKSYRIKVSDSQNVTIWDSGVVESPLQNNIEYGGSALKSREPYKWEVTVTGINDQQSSSESVFETSFISPDEWTAKWIEPSASDMKEWEHNVPYFGKSFSIPEGKKVKRARVYASALGVFTMKLNGIPVTENLFEPGETEYEKSVLYSTYDVTPLIKQGSNAILAQVAGGLFNVTPLEGRYSKGEIQNNGHSSLLAEIVIDYTDGSADVICTDDTWKCAASPTIGSNWWGGEDYDASLFDPEVGKSDYSFSGWKHAVEVTPSFQYPHVRKSFTEPGKLKSRSHEPLRVVETWNAVKSWQLPNGDYIVDFGRNYAGTYKFRLKGRKGQKIKLREFECLDSAGYGRVDHWYTGPGIVHDEYTFCEDGKEESWGPEFMYHGFRYMQISGLDTIPDPSAFTAERIRSNMDCIGSFTCSNPLLNSIHVLCRDAIQSQLYNCLTDCPQREKLGWLEVSQEMFNSLCFNYDLTTFWKKVIMDCYDAQGENGFVPSMAPWYMDVYSDDPNWGGAAILVPYRSYLRYGDKSNIKEFYPQMKKLIEYYTTHVKDGIMENYSVLSDWGQGSCQLDVETPTEFTITTTYYHLLQAMATMAGELGYMKDAEHYSLMANEVKDAFNKKFYKGDGVYNNGNQAEYGMALYYGLVDKENEKQVASRLAEKVRHDGYRIRTGEIGLKPVLMSLAKYGYNDVVYKMANQTDYPSYGFFVVNGCTTTPEYWDLTRADNSQNHCMMDHIEEWFYSELGGIKNKGIAFNEIELSPWIPDDMESVDVKSETIYGTVRSKWHKNADNGYDFEFTVPANTTATIKIPLKHTNGIVCENGKPLKEGSNGIHKIAFADDEVEILVGSGDYRFTNYDSRNSEIL